MQTPMQTPMQIPMQISDSLRRNGYAVAFVFGLAATFELMAGAGWAAAAMLLSSMTVIAVVEHIADLRQREPRFAAHRA